MSTKQSPNIAAVLKTAKAQVTITTLPIPQPGPNEVLVRNYAVAANPCDWKIQSHGIFIEKFPNVLGSDIAGVIEAIGPDVTKFKVGDRVTGFAAMVYNQQITHGAWQTYTLLRTIATAKLPSHITFINGSVLPMGFATAACSLYIDLKLPRTPITSLPSPEKAEGFLVWGGASSVGSSVIQLAKNSGFKVFTTASKKHEGWLKSIGAYAVFDYHDSDVVEKVVEAAKRAGTTIKLGVDAVTEGSLVIADKQKKEGHLKSLGVDKINEAAAKSEVEVGEADVTDGDTAKMAADVLALSGGTGNLVTTLPWPEKYERPQGIETTNGGAVRMFLGDEQELGEWFFNDYLQGALENGSVVPAPSAEVVEGGIGATQKVWDLLKKGVSGKKLVVKVE